MKVSRLSLTKATETERQKSDPSTGNLSRGPATPRVPAPSSPGAHCEKLRVNGEGGGPRGGGAGGRRYTVGPLCIYESGLYPVPGYTFEKEFAIYFRVHLETTCTLFRRLSMSRYFSLATGSLAA